MRFQKLRWLRRLRRIGRLLLLLGSSIVVGCSAGDLTSKAKRSSGRLDASAVPGGACGGDRDAVFERVTVSGVSKTGFKSRQMIGHIQSAK